MPLRSIFHLANTGALFTKVAGISLQRQQTTVFPAP